MEIESWTVKCRSLEERILHLEKELHAYYELKDRYSRVSSELEVWRSKCVTLEERLVILEKDLHAYYSL